MNAMHLTVLRASIARLPKDTDCPASARIRQILNRLEGEASAIYELATKPDPLRSAAATAMVINNEKSKLRALLDSSRATLAGIVADFRAADAIARVKKAHLQMDDYATETRAIWRSFDRINQATYMHAAINAGDSATVAAIVLAPTAVTGLTQAEADEYKEALLDKLAASDCGDVADELQAVVDNCMTALVEFATPDFATA